MDCCPTRGQTLLPEGNPSECLPVSLLFQSYTEHLSTSKLAAHHVSKIHISRKEWPLLRCGHLWPHLTCIVPSPLSMPESEHRVAV